MKTNTTRAQQVQSALTLIGKLFVEEMDAGCAGVVNWKERYEQEQIDHRLTSNALMQASQERDKFRMNWFKLDNEQARNATTLETAGVQLAAITKERDEWVRRFNALDADMRGTMMTLEKVTRDNDAHKALLPKLMDSNEKHCDEIARLQSVLDTIQLACKGN